MLLGLLIWREKERYRIRAVQMDNFRGLLGIRRMDKFLDARVRQMFGGTKGVDKNIDKGVFRCFDHGERMENNRIAKRIYVRECAGSRSAGRPRKRWINTVKNCLKKRCLDVRQA